MKYFLLEFDRRENRPNWTTFDDKRLALDALRTTEAARQDHVEVVLLMARSLDDLRMTHSRYFPGELERSLNTDRRLDQALSDAVVKAIGAQAS